MRTTHLPELEQYRLANRDPDALTITRGVLKGAREFIADGIRTTLEHDEGAGEVHIRVLKGHQNHARELAEALTHRFALDVERDGDTITVPTEELETGADR